MNKNHVIIFFIMFSMLLMISCKTNMYNETNTIIRKMTIDEKIGQMLMVGVPDRKITKETESIINNYYPGGVILFGYNLGKNRDEIKKYINDMQQAAFTKYRIPLFISIDQEGGRVRRITDGVTQFPGAMAFGAADNESMTYQAARILGIELRITGVNMNLAPVLDVNNNPQNPVINTRSFGSDAEAVSRLGVSYINGLQKSDCIAVGKHFPGHGDTDTDSHLTLPVINHDIERLRKIEFLPFVRAIDNNVEAIMTAHISFPNILKDDLPATVSRYFLTDILRKEMKYEGIIITDDMEMNAVSKFMDFGEAAVKTIQAGSDIVLISTHGKSIETAAKSLRKAVDDGRISLRQIDESVKRIIEVKLRYHIMDYKEGETKNPEYICNKEDSDELKKSAELNGKISREAIYFYSNGPYPLMLPEINSINIFITSNSTFIKEIKSQFNANSYKIYMTGKDFLKHFTKEQFKGSGSKGLENARIYYQSDKNEAGLIREISSRIHNTNSKFYMLYTGNPFLLGTAGDIPSTLFSFSNTDESIKQMVLCLKGDFKPKEKINYYLGFGEEK